MFRKLKHKVVSSAQVVNKELDKVVQSVTSSASTTAPVHASPARVDVDVDVDAVDATLAPCACHPRVVAHYGVERTSSALSFVSNQGILLVSTAHGVKAYGARGLEVLYPGVGGDGDRERSVVGFVDGAARIFATCANDTDEIIVWDARDQRVLAANDVRLNENEGTLTCAHALRGSAFTLVGTSSGTLRAACVDVVKGQSVVRVRSQYGATVDEIVGKVLIGVNARMIAIAPQPGLENENARCVAAYGDGSMALWHLHERRAVAIASGNGMAAGNGKRDGGSGKDGKTVDRGDKDGVTTTCFAWLDARTTATGKSDGSVWVHRVPAASSSANEIECVQRQVFPYRIVDPSHNGALMAIRALRTVLSDDDDGARGATKWLVCVGGEPFASPDPVMLLRLSRVGAEGFRIDVSAASARALPWFGPVIDAVPIPGRDGDAVESVAVLSEGSQIHLHDARVLNRESESDSAEDSLAPPHVISVARPIIATACAPSVCAASDEVIATFTSNIECLDGERNRFDASAGWCGGRWPISGGCESTSSSYQRLRARVIVAAHGRDASGIVMFIDDGGRLIPGGHVGTSGDALSYLHVHAGGALFVAGRASGKVELYALRKYAAAKGDRNARNPVYVRRLERDHADLASEEARFLADAASIPRDFLELDSASACVTSAYTLVATFASPTHDRKRITCARVNASATLLAVGDSAGGISLLDLRRGAARWSVRAASGKEDGPPLAVAAFDFGLPIPTRPDENVLAVLDVESGVRFHALSSGQRVGAAVRPKSPTKALAISLLKVDGTPADGSDPPAFSHENPWFAPPSDFSYSFLTAEFDDDDALDVDEEDMALSTDEEPHEGAEGPTPKFTALVVTVSSEALRVYTSTGCARGERSTLRKVRLEAPLAHASVVRSGDFAHGRGASCVAGISTDGRFLTFSSPAFDTIDQCGPVQSLMNLNTAAIASDGSCVVVANDGAAMARLETTAGASAPAAGRVIDEDVASAAEAARAARMAMGENDNELAMETTSKRAAAAGAATPPTPPGANFKNRMSALRDRAKAAMEKLATPSSSKGDDAEDRSNGAEGVKYTTTDLALLFAEVRLEAPSPVSAPPPPPTSPPSESTQRAELLATSKAARASAAKMPSPREIAPVKRSANDIRAKYRVAEVADSTREIRDRVVQRGEKLSRLQDKSAALEDDAASFADLCAELRKETEKRSWL